MEDPLGARHYVICIYLWIDITLLCLNINTCCHEYRGKPAWFSLLNSFWYTVDILTEILTFSSAPMRPRIPSLEKS